MSVLTNVVISAGDNGYFLLARVYNNASHPVSYESSVEKGNHIHYRMP
jgi:hypothetical protein